MTWENHKNQEKQQQNTLLHFFSSTCRMKQADVQAAHTAGLAAAAGFARGKFPLRRPATAVPRAPRPHDQPGPLCRAAVAQGAGTACPWENHRYLHSTSEPEPCRLAVPPQETEPSPSFFTQGIASRVTKIKHLQGSKPHRSPARPRAARLLPRDGTAWR